MSLSSFTGLEETLLVHANVVGQDLHDGACYPLPYTPESTVSLGSLFQTLFGSFTSEIAKEYVSHLSISR